MRYSEGLWNLVMWQLGGRVANAYLYLPPCSCFTIKYLSFFDMFTEIQRATTKCSL